jgi:hypothetical protein
MALTNDDITSITERYFHPVLVDNIFNSNAALQRAKRKWYERIGGGTKIVVPLLYATTANAERYSGSQTLNVNGNSQITSAEFEWKQYKASIPIEGLDELKNDGDAQVINFVKAKVQAAEKSLANMLGTDLFSDGTTAGSLIGFKQMIKASGTYGIIDRSSNSWWNAQVDGTTTAISLPKVQGLIGDAQVDSDKPTVMFTTQNVYDDIWGLIQPQQRFADEDTVKAGFTNILVNGIPVVVDSHVDSGFLYMVNENYIKLKVHKKRDFVLTPFQKPTNQDVSIAHVFWAGAMCGNNCRMQAAFTALT